MTNALACAERYRLAWQREKMALDLMVREAAIAKAILPANYWQAEHAARAKYNAALDVVKALQEAAA